MGYSNICFEKVNNNFIKLVKYDENTSESMTAYYRDENGELVKTEEFFQNTWYTKDTKKEIDGEIYGFRAGIVYKINDLVRVSSKMEN